MKGGVGKTSLTVNLAWLSAVRSSRRTLLWDLDAQGGASFILGAPPIAGQARDIIARDADPETRIVRTAVPGLDLLAADASLRGLDALFADLERKKRLRRLVEQLGQTHDRIFLDCPPGLGPTAEQIIRGASLILVPLIPSTLSRRALDEVEAHLRRHHKEHAVVIPVFNMVDQRRAAHRAAIAAAPDWPMIPMSSLVEQMADRHAAVVAYAPRAPVSRALADLWVQIERRLAAIA
jgi:cellulose biosynthesis protein BcsQ